MTTSYASKDKSEVKIIAKYPEENIMLSGWMLGENTAFIVAWVSCLPRQPSSEKDSLF